MSYTDDVEAMRKQVLGEPTMRLMAARWQLEQQAQRLRRDAIPPMIWREAWRRHCGFAEVLDLELEARWLKVAPTMEAGATLGLIERDWIRSALYDFAIG